MMLTHKDKDKYQDQEENIQEESVDVYMGMFTVL